MTRDGRDPDPMGRPDRRPRLLLVGLPRSGTTWLFDMLRRPRSVLGIYEPDNEKLDPMGWWAKRGMHRFPFLLRDDEAEEFRRFWEFVLSGRWPCRSLVYRGLQQWFRTLHGNRLEAHVGDKTGVTYFDPSWNHARSSAVPFPDGGIWPVTGLARRYGASRTGYAGPLVVKSVHLPLALDWVSRAFQPTVLLLLRNPFSVLTSLERQRYPDGWRNVFAQPRLLAYLRDVGADPGRIRVTSRRQAVGLQILVMFKVLSVQMEEHPEWAVVSHDRLCAAPESELDHLVGRLPEPWHACAPSSLIDEAQDLESMARQPTKWRDELGREDTHAVHAMIRHLDLGPFLSRHVYSEVFDYALD